MNYERFERRAQEIFEAIPAELRQGVEFVSVSPETVRHPEMPDVFTLGECATGELDLPGGLAADARSGVYLYHGSFREMARRDPTFDWHDELRETVLHEIRHHRESMAGEDALEDLDWAEEENRKRRDGKPFDPLFYRRGFPVGAGAWEVDGDLFVEREISLEEFERDEEIEVMVGGMEVDLGFPERLGDVHFIYLDGLWDEDIDVAVVLVRRQGAWEQLRRVVSARPPEVLTSSMDYSDVELPYDDDVVLEEDEETEP